MQLVLLVYRVSQRFPENELYGVTSQIRRCFVSISSNIAEGRNRGSTREFVRFLWTAYGSGAELETQLEICRNLGYIAGTDYDEIHNSLNEIMRMLNTLIRKMRSGAKT